MRNELAHVALFCCVLLTTGVVHAQAPTIGPCALPDWSSQAQTTLAWVFDDPEDPGSTDPLTGWDVFVGDPPAPTWDYDAQRIVWSAPGQWHIQIPNVQDLDGHKKYWLCFVFERDRYYGGNYVFRNMDWTPFDSEENATISEELFDATGTTTANVYEGVYARMLFTGDMYPCPATEDIWLGVVGNGTSTDGDAVWEVLEVYFMALPLGIEIFSDDFETGDTTGWSTTIP